MLLKPPIPMAPLLPTTQQAIWGRSSWVRLRARSLPTEVVIGGRHTVAGVSTIPTPRRTAVLTGDMVIIRMRRLTMITTPERTDGMGALTARMARRPPELVIIHTLGRTLEAGQFPRLTAPGAQHRLTIRTQAPMRRPGKVPVQQPSGAVPTSHEEIRALAWAITRQLMEQ
jgi:hypothetical protein